MPSLYWPRDVSSADLVIKNQQGIKAEIEARADRFSSCIDMGQELLARSHYAAEEVGETRKGPGQPHRTWIIPEISLSVHFVCFFGFFLGGGLLFFGVFCFVWRQGITM